jgi:hypothetical protein
LNRIPLEYKIEALPLAFWLDISILLCRFLEIRELHRAHKYFEISAVDGTEFPGSFFNSPSAFTSEIVVG